MRSIVLNIVGRLLCRIIVATFGGDIHKRSCSLVLSCSHRDGWRITVCLLAHFIPTPCCDKPAHGLEDVASSHQGSGQMASMLSTVRSPRGTSNGQAGRTFVGTSHMLIDRCSSIAAVLSALVLSHQCMNNCDTLWFMRVSRVSYSNSFVPCFPSRTHAPAPYLHLLTTT